MITDAHNKFSTAQTGAFAAGSAISTNVIDLNAGVLSPTLRDLGTGRDMTFVVSIDTTFTSSGSATVAFSLESDSTANLATSATVHYTTAALVYSTLTAGSIPVMVKLPQGVTYERYLGARCTVAVATTTAGAFSAYLVETAQAWNAYPKNYTIS